MSAPDADKYRACVHEAGHAVLASKSDAANPERVWVAQKERTWVGVTYKSNPNLEEPDGLQAEIVAAWGGCQAEEVVLGSCNAVAASNDEALIERMLLLSAVPAANWPDIKMLARVSANELTGQYRLADENMESILGGRDED